MDTAVHYVGGVWEVVQPCDQILLAYARTPQGLHCLHCWPGTYKQRIYLLCCPDFDVNREYRICEHAIEKLLLDSQVVFLRCDKYMLTVNNEICGKRCTIDKGELQRLLTDEALFGLLSGYEELFRPGKNGCSISLDEERACRLAAQNRRRLAALCPIVQFEQGTGLDLGCDVRRAIVEQAVPRLRRPL